MSGGTFEISSRKSGKLLDVQGASTADNATVVQWTGNNGADQRWQLVDAGNGYSKLKNLNRGKVLGVSGRPRRPALRSSRSRTPTPTVSIGRSFR